MECRIKIIGTDRQLDILSMYSKVTTPKMWGDKTWLERGVCKFDVCVRVPEESRISEGGTYAFREYLKRTDDLKLLDLIADIEKAEKKYKEC